MQHGPTLVGDIMRTRLITVTPDVDLGEALAAMADHGVRRLPVVKTVAGDSVLQGIVTDRDLRLAVGSPYAHADVGDVVEDLRRLTVAHVMTRDVITVFPSATVAQAARLMLAHRIGGLPVIEQEEGRPFLVGIVTRSDLLQVLVDVETRLFPV